MTKCEIIRTQCKVGTEPDGFWGPKSISACQKYLRALMPKPSPWPYPSERDLKAFCGEAGDVSKLVNLPVAGLGVKYQGKAVRTVRCHSKVADSLLRIIKKLSESHPQVLAEYNGCYNFRRMRGGTRYSLHARGAAIDFMASTNGNRTSWPVKADMPIEVMEIFASEGWLPAGAFWHRDAMHFQATK